MKSGIQLFLVAEIAIFAFAASAHFELFGDRDDPGAGIAESVIAVVLLAGLAYTFMQNTDVRSIALGVQGFALLGTLIGTYLVLVVGPRTTFDIVVHVIMLTLLIAGLVVTYRAPKHPAQ